MGHLLDGVLVDPWYVNSLDAVFEVRMCIDPTCYFTGSTCMSDDRVVEMTKH